VQPSDRVNSGFVSQQRIKARLYVIAVLIFISVGMIGGLLNIAWTYMQVTFKVEVSAIGVLLVCATGGGLVAAFSSGMLIGRFGIGRIAVLGTTATALGLVGVVLSPAWLILLVIIFVMYMGRGTLDAGMNNFVSERYSSVAMIWLHASWGLGLTIAPSLMTYIIITQQMSWRAGYGVMIGVMLLLLAAVLFYQRYWDMPMNGLDAAMEAQRLLQRAQMRETIQQPVVLWSALLFFIYGGVEIGTGQLANTLLVESRSIDQETASLWISLYWGCFTVGRIFDWDSGSPC
jgi:fucose permease